VLPPSTSEDERLAELLDELGCRYVRIASVALDEPQAMLVTHDDAGAREAARHLASLGHVRIGHISGPSSFRSAHVRKDGFVEGLREHGLELEPRYWAEGGYTFESGVACATELLSLKPRPTAIFAGNDEMALGVLRAARDLGIDVPGELSVVGYDDSPMATRVWPSLTTVRLPIRDMGRIAARKLLAAPDGPRKDAEEVQPSLVVRSSSGPPPR
jgi:LacI family transcriptional regulator